MEKLAMNLWKGAPVALAVLINIQVFILAEEAQTTFGYEKYGYVSYAQEQNDEAYNEYEDAYYEETENSDSTGLYCEDICEEPCEQECWIREICYEPVFYTTQKFVEKQIPTKKKRARLVPKEYTVQRVRYIPDFYTEKVIKNEMEYYYEDDWKVQTEMVCERQCQWVPRSVWKKVTQNLCETQQDD